MNPGNATAANWTPLLLTSPSQFRPAPPPPCDSAQVQAEVALVRNTPRGVTAFATNYKAFYWQSPEGLNYWPFRYLDKWLFEDGLDRNPPRAARAYALVTAVLFDAFIGTQDGKFAYWYIRPSQLDPAIVPLFPVPNFPSYPSNHSTFSAARSEMLAYLFPTRADYIRGIGKEGGDSRWWPRQKLTPNSTHGRGRIRRAADVAGSEFLHPSRREECARSNFWARRPCTRV